MLGLPFGVRGRHAWRAAAVLASLALVFGMTGCGVTMGAGGASTSTPGATVTPTGGALERACDGPDGSVSDAGTVNLVLSTLSPLATGTPGADGFEPYAGSAHVGDIVQVQLPTTNRWGLSTASGGLTLLNPSAMLDASHGVCFWNFKAMATGDTTLNFVGGALCSPSQACPLYARLVSFLVHVA